MDNLRSLRGNAGDSQGKMHPMDPPMQRRRLNLEREKPAPLNWRRGMFRLWILVSAAWVMGWLLYLSIEYIGGQATAGQLLVAPIVLLGPPVALLLFGIATRWAFRGFEADDGS
jgi:hypothetical protein